MSREAEAATATGSGGGFAQVFKWGARGFWAILDQALTAIGNFILSVMLARWMSEGAYGGFSIAYSTLLLVGAVHTAIITEPLLVHAQGAYSGLSGSYLGFVTRAHWLLTAGAALVAAGAVAVLEAAGPGQLPTWILAVLASGPFFLLSWVGRRAAFAFLRPGLAALGSAVYLLVLVGGLWLLRGWDAIGLESAFLLLAAAGLLSGALVIVCLRLTTTAASSEGESAFTTADAAARHWRYGRWALATAILAWIPGNLFYFVLPLRAGLAGAGALRALVNLTTPVMHLINALGTFVIPVLARKGRMSGSYSVPRSLAAAFVVVPAAYWLALGLFGEDIVRWLYSGNYVHEAASLWILGILPCLAGLIAVLGSELRARERIDLVFWSVLAAGLIALTAGTAATLAWGVPGAAVGWVLAYVVNAAGLWWLLRMRANHR